MVRVYYSHPMTGRDPSVVLLESANASSIAKEIGGIELIDPVVVEGIRPGRKPIKASLEQLRDVFWPRDKQDVKWADVVVTDEGRRYSHGCVNEYGLSRFWAWNPTIRVFPNLNDSVSNIEGDYVAKNMAEALLFIKSRFGSRWQRFVWRLKIVPRGLVKLTVFQLAKFFV